ncbi:hypothetical protein BMS3Abin01_01343 [bacterium BMS3Abin01]|nr:hypothetical protein BMS3Abin01_01343 [bacterium BMS3Abin01]
MQTMAVRLSDWYAAQDPRRQRRLIAGLFMLLQAFIWLVLFKVLWYGDKTITDTPVYYEYAGRIAAGMMPYRDFSSEYPPVAMLLFSLPRLFSGSSYRLFVFWFEVEMLVFSLGIIALLTLLAGRLYRSNSRVALTLALYTLFVLSLGSIVQARFDIAVAFLILACITLFALGRQLPAWALLGLGIMTKIVPVLIGPLFLIAHWRRRQYGDLWRGPAVALLAAAVVSLPFLLAAPAGLAGSFLYHVERPLQIESSWASPLLLAHNFSGYAVRIMNSYGSHNVFASLSDSFAFLSGPVTVLLLLAGYRLYWRRGFDGMGGWSRESLIRFAAIAMATFIVGGKVFSPQFMIWLLPLLPLLTSRKDPWPGAIYWVALVLTQWEFPYRYWELYLMRQGMVVEVAMRNLTLAVMVTLLVLFSRPRDEDVRWR